MDPELNEYLQEYMRALELPRSQELFELELRTALPRQPDPEAKLIAMWTGAGKSRKETGLKKELKEQAKKYKQVLQAGRQIFSVAISLLQMLHSLKETSSNESVLDSMENYKIQLGKHHKTIINEGNPGGAELIADSVIYSHKQNLAKYVREGNLEKLVEVFLSLRVNALQIAPELRKSLVLELIRKDLLHLSEGQTFLLSILENSSRPLQYAVLSLLSVIASLVKGVEYLTAESMAVLERVISIMKEQENGSITQRFALAILQKASVKEPVIPTFLQLDLLPWILALLKRSFVADVNPFCLDFASALLANIVHSRPAQQFLTSRPEVARHLAESLLRFLREKIQVSVLMHLLISLNYLYKEPFKAMLAEISFKDRITEFASQYGRSARAQEASEIDRKTVLDLCNHVFHSKPKDEEDEEAQVLEYENEHNELIFECFQDEVTN